MRWRDLISRGARTFVAGLAYMAITSVSILPAYSTDELRTGVESGLDRPLETIKKKRRFVPLNPRTTTDGILRLDEPISVRVNDVLLRVPAGFISPWPHAGARNRINESSALRFEFWMPDKRYLEISPLSNADFRPLEPGRGEPGSDAYIVRVWDLRPIKLSEPGYVSPEQAFRNEIGSRQPPGSQYRFQEEEF